MIHLILFILLISFIIRLITRPFRRHRFYGYGGYYRNPYQYGCRRHHRFLGGLFPIIALVALDRILGRRF